MGILAKVLLIGFAAFYVLGILLYVMAPMLWRFIRHKRTRQRLAENQGAPPPRGRSPGTEPGDPNNKRR